MRGGREVACVEIRLCKWRSFDLVEVQLAFTCEARQPFEAASWVKQWRGRVEQIGGGKVCR